MPSQLSLSAYWNAFLNGQHRYPTGLVGRIIGERMVQQHALETRWTVEQLAIAPTDRVLELGFGAGRGIELASQAASGGTVVGIDLSRAMVRAARHRNHDEIQKERISLLRSDFIALPFAGQSFDKIYSIHTFYFWPAPIQLLQELLLLLKPRGVLMITLSTGQTTSTGERIYTDLQYTLESRILPSLRGMDVSHAELLHGPDSRQYNNVAVRVQT